MKFNSIRERYIERWDLKAGAMREFSPKEKGERREARPGENFRQEIYRREIPPPPPFRK
ncbi:MAG: hypothetical protein M1170_01145 [Patescibacteria group bacterium]|nr:hypothetical protein [Patescibacteria group bacterium]